MPCQVSYIAWWLLSETGILNYGAVGIWGGQRFIVENSEASFEAGLGYSNNTMLRTGSIEGAACITQDGNSFSVAANPTGETSATAYAIRPAFNLNMTKLAYDLGDLERRKSVF